ncbi:LTA synthase family protein [Gluconobacter cerinus]|uniref:Capsule biosynthesis protein n=1 Tax=Gluconobacter cerinus TaxID=38307 RepID=A0A1B6VIS6_9PROT|nr:LTA synthase family protein [Gluconobacter cerinus]OAJ66857.1 capsule biosynthesis protein [Gluconobacter cerinus]
MKNVLFSLFCTVVFSILFDRFTRPDRCGGRGYTLHILSVLTFYGATLALTGGFWVACVLTDALFLALVIASNIKFRVLGEPLVFSDLAVAASFLRYPRFYLAAIPNFLKIILIPAVILVFGCVIAFSSTAPAAHFTGLLILLASLLSFGAGWKFYWCSSVMFQPDLEADIVQYGLLPVLLIYTLRWRATSSPPPAQPLPAREPGTDPVPLLIIVQCESFADPKDLVPDHPLAPLNNFERLKTISDHYGTLSVSGFGAYTMRTEYAVLCGRDEEELGFRAFDPFLTAQDECTFGLPNRLAALYEKRLFVHPHDLRFYGRDRLMPALGFTTLVGPDDFAHAETAGPYISDKAIGDYLHDRIVSAEKPELIYVVTMENHGPWDAGRLDATDALTAWERHAQNGDALLGSLDRILRDCGRPAHLIFFGDHRPSIPGYVTPSKIRSTPFISLSYHNHEKSTLFADINIKPAELHRSILGKYKTNPRN